MAASRLSAGNVQDTSFYNLAQFPNAAGILNIGTTQIDPGRHVIYAQMAALRLGSARRCLQIVDDDNLTVRESLQLPENAAGKSALKNDGSVMYSVSDSGVLVLPVGNLNQSPRLAASVEDVVFRGNFCDRTVATQTFMVNDPGGNKTPFTISSSNPGVRVSASSRDDAGGDHGVGGSQRVPELQGHRGDHVDAILGAGGQCARRPIRVLINSREPNQRGTFINVPGTLKDLAADPVRDQYYVLRQDMNQVLVFKGSNNTKMATLRTCTTPMSMTITYDRQYLLIGCDNSHYVWVYDLDTFERQQSIRMSTGDYVQSIAASARAILAVTRDSGGSNPNFHRIDFASRTSVSLPSLGVWENKVPLEYHAERLAQWLDHRGGVRPTEACSCMTPTWTALRFPARTSRSLSGAVAASSYGQYVIGNQIFDSSLVPTATIQPTNGNSSGFIFLDQNGFFVSAADSASPGVLARVNASNGTATLPTGVVEAPAAGSYRREPSPGLWPCWPAAARSWC